MNTPSNSQLLVATTLRVFYAFAAFSALVAIGNVALAGTVLAPGPRGILFGAFAVFAAAALLAMRLPAEPARRALLPLVLAALVAIGSTALATGWGLRAPGLYFLGVICCMTCTVAPRGQGLTVALVSAALVLVLAAAESQGVVLSSTGPGAAPLLSMVLVQLGAIAVGAGAGLMLGRLTMAAVRESGEREQRFRDLLGLAAEAYWETDDALRISHVSRRQAGSEFVTLPLQEPAAAWDIPGLQFDDDVLDRVRAEMEAREPVRSVPMAWRQRDGSEHVLLASGEPRFDAGGRFIGYWGVARDVTTEHRDRAALIDTELRYRELFRCTPTPLLLHREGIVLEANQAAVAMFGFAAASALRGQSLKVLFSETDWQRLGQRLATLDTIAEGEGMPLAVYALVAQDGRNLRIRATAVRADFGGLPANLSIFIDETRQRTAAAAQQRSETLLRQVVAISPDIITLTDLDTGRYLMVNDSFSRVTGYAASDVIGRTASEVGFWATPEDRERLIATLQSQGAVKDMAISAVHREGHRLPMLLSASRFASEGRAFLVTNARDTSEANRERLEREAILANASVGLAHTRDRRFVMVNPAFERMYGWPPGTLVGQPARLVWCSDEDYESLGAEIGPALRRGEPVEVERMGRRHDDSSFLVRVRAKAIDPQQAASGGTIWIAEDVTAQRQAERELARARDAAEAANRAKSAFLANTSHEIRTPLNGLVGLARMARQPDVDPQRMHLYLEQIGASAETLSMIISDILDLSKIEAGRLEVESAPFDLLDMLHSLHRAYTALADGRGLQFDMQVDPGLPERVLGDALRVRQILVNFLHNALKFTPRGEVRLHVRALPSSRVRFEVCDTGPGIDAATQERLFKPFTQADESITRRFGGTGLGLSICRELAVLMGGQVGLHSVVGEGSCFHAELLLPPVPVVDAASDHGALEADVLLGARVLLVEDNAVNMMIAVAMLEQWGMQVAQAEDGALALAAVERSVAEGRPYDAVLMDVQMPGMSGYEATTLLRQRWTAQQLPVIALTAAALVSEREHALAVGMNDFVTKPIEAERLRHALRRVLEGETRGSGA